MKPTRFGNYCLIDKLDRGPVTDVYLAVAAGSPSIDNLVVIKRQRSSQTHPDELRSQDVPVPTDADHACLLHHPGIATTYEVATSEDMPYWAVEHIPGQPLDAVLAAAKRGVGLSDSTALHIVAELLQALDYAHSRANDAGEPLHLFHGDVRPRNVIISYDGEVKLVDFGVPRRSVKRELLEEADPYSAPEQATGSIDQRADIYATGQLLKALYDPHGTRLSLPSGTVPGWQPEAGPDGTQPSDPLATQVRSIWQRATQPEPGARYPTAAAMLLDIGRALEQLPTSYGAAEAQAGLAAWMQDTFGVERQESARRIETLVHTAAAELGTQAHAAPLTIFPNSESTASEARSPLRLSLPTEAYAEQPSDVDTQAMFSPSDPSRPSTPPPPLPNPADEDEDTRLHTPLAYSEPPSIPPAEPSSDRNSDSAKRSALVAVALLAVGAIAVNKLMGSFGTEPKPQAQAQAQVQAAAAVASAPEAPAAEAAVLRLCGSNTVGAELAPALVEGLFMYRDNARRVARHGGGDSVTLSTVDGDRSLTAEITAHGSATAFKGLADGSCDVGMASRSIEPAEIDQLQQLGLGDLSAEGNEHVIALDGVAVIVHPNNALSALDRHQLHDIFTGNLTDWSGVSGASGPIRVLARDDQSGTFDTFRELVLDGDPLLEGSERYELNNALADAVASDPAAIGFVGLPYVRTAKALAVGEPGATPLLPTRFTVATEAYPLSRRLYLYTTDKPRTPWVTEFVNFALSPRGQKIAAAAQFVDLELTTDSVMCDAETCPPLYAAHTANARRVSVDLRFVTGSDQPDSRARHDLDRLTSYLRNFRDPKLMLFGFSDNVGDPSLNTRLSRERADAIARQLQMRGVQPAFVAGLGSELPLASNDTERGRARNRRVEVWVQHM